MSIRYRVRDLSEAQDLRLFVLFESHHSTKIIVLADCLKFEVEVSSVNHPLRGKEGAVM